MWLKQLYAIVMAIKEIGGWCIEAYNQIKAYMLQKRIEERNDEQTHNSTINTQIDIERKKKDNDEALRNLHRNRK